MDHGQIKKGTHNMQSNTTNAETMTAKDHRIQVLLETISALRSSLEECFEYVQEEEFNNPSNKTADIIGRADDAIYMADGVTTQ
jgi:hypothetical protein